jgi:hypothetical protein
MNEYEAFAPDDISRPVLSSSHDMHTSSMLNALKTENNHLKGIIREVTCVVLLFHYTSAV